jgi:hypothetical protein
MENLVINWKMIICVIILILVSLRLLVSFKRWSIETNVIKKVKVPSEITVQGYLYWIGSGLNSIFWLIVLFMSFYVMRV